MGAKPKSEQVSIPDTGYEQHCKLPNGNGAKIQKHVGPGCPPSPSSVKINNLSVMLVDDYAND